jgi:hypothetical protein
MIGNVRSDPDFMARSNIVLADAWDEICKRHIEHEAIIGVLVSLPIKLDTGEQTAVEIRFHVLRAAEQAKLCDQFAKYSADTAAAIAAPHQPELVRVLFIEDPSGQMRFLALPVAWSGAAIGA